MSDEPAVRCEQVSKTYRRNPTRRLRRSAEHRAVDAVDLEIGRGETIGILGHNGAGKTTLLKLLAGVTAPSAGRIVTRGRVVPLISVGVGFHGELSGHENVRVNATILGLTADEIDDRMASIIDFAELTGSMDQPVKFFSTGMQLRLAFAVAMHARPDVLLLDEILAVGDTGFQLKCFERMSALQESGVTIVFVSQSVHAIRLLCPRAIVMDHGSVAFDGPSDVGVVEYHRLLTSSAVASRAADLVDVTEVELLDERGRHPIELHLGRRYTLRHRLRASAPAVVAGTRVVFRSEAGTEAHRSDHTLPATQLDVGDDLELDVTFECALLGGTYRVEVDVIDPDGAVVGASAPGAAVYRTPEPGTYGIADLGAVISIGGRVINDHEAIAMGRSGR